MKVFAILLAALLPLSAHAADWKVDTTRSRLGFTGHYQGEAFHGRFRTFDARIRFDPRRLGRSSFDVTVMLESVDTRNRERDQTLTGRDFFATVRFPTAHFVTTGFRHDADGRVLADGILDLHGVKQPVTLRVAFARHGADATLEVDTRLDRLAYGLGSAPDWNDIANQVQVHARLLLHHAP